MNSQQGFTLVEFSIVMVMIGLVVGAVLVGQDLIESKKTRDVIPVVVKCFQGDVELHHSVCYEAIRQQLQDEYDVREEMRIR